MKTATMMLVAAMVAFGLGACNKGPETVTVPKAEYRQTEQDLRNAHEKVTQYEERDRRIAAERRAFGLGHDVGIVGAFTRLKQCRTSVAKTRLVADKDFQHFGEPMEQEFFRGCRAGANENVAAENRIKQAERQLRAQREHVRSQADARKQQRAEKKKVEKSAKAAQQKDHVVRR